MLVFRLSTNAPVPTRYALLPRLAGFPSKGLLSLCRFVETTLTTGLVDDVTGARYSTSGLVAIDANNAEQALTAAINGGSSAGGGLKLTGLRNLTTVSVDITKPFTVLVAATAPLPVDQTPQGVVAAGTIPTAGLMAYYQILQAPALGTPYPIYVMPTKNGSLNSNAAAAVGLPLVAQYSSLAFFQIKHLGNGAFVIAEARGGGLSSLSMTLDLATIQGAAGSQTANQPIAIGGVYPGVGNKVGMIYDALAVYDHATSAVEDQAFYDAAAALALTRGRS